MNTLGARTYFSRSSRVDLSTGRNALVNVDVQRSERIFTNKQRAFVTCEKRPSSAMSR